LLTLRNILHGSVDDATGLCNDNLLLTMWRVTDVALSGVLLRSGVLLGEVSSMTVVEADMTEGDSMGWWCRLAQHSQWWG
jgi:hypothetical protein